MVTAYTNYVEVEYNTESSTFLSDRVIYDDSGSNLKGSGGQPVAGFTIYP